MVIGSVVIPKGDRTLRKGAKEFQAAIVCLLDPFTLVSVDAQEVWNAGIKPEYFLTLCTAHPTVVNKCLQRIPAPERRVMEVPGLTDTNVLPCGLVLIKDKPEEHAVELRNNDAHGMCYVKHRKNPYWVPARMLSPRELEKAKEQYQQGIVEGGKPRKVGKLLED